MQENLTDEQKSAEIFRRLDTLLKPCGWPAQKLLRDYVESIKKVLFAVPPPDDRDAEIEQLTKQNNAYKSLVGSLARRMATLQASQADWREAVSTLASERLANAVLTDEIAALREAFEYLLESVINKDCGEVDRRLAVKDARIALALESPSYRPKTRKENHKMQNELTQRIAKLRVEAERVNLPVVLALLADVQDALDANDAEQATLSENGPLMERCSDGDGKPIMGTMMPVLQDYRSAADYEAGEVDRLNAEIAALKEVIEGKDRYNTRLCAEINIDAQRLRDAQDAYEAELTALRSAAKLALTALERISAHGVMAVHNGSPAWMLPIRLEKDCATSIKAVLKVMRV